MNITIRNAVDVATATTTTLEAPYRCSYSIGLLKVIHILFICPYQAMDV